MLRDLLEILNKSGGFILIAAFIAIGYAGLGVLGGIYTVAVLLILLWDASR